MNRRSRIKSTLDSLFSGGKAQSPEPETPAAPPQPQKTESTPAVKTPIKTKTEKKPSLPKTSAPAEKQKPVAKKTLPTKQASVQDNRTDRSEKAPADSLPPVVIQTLDLPVNDPPAAPLLSEDPKPVEMTPPPGSPAVEETVAAEKTTAVGQGERSLTSSDDSLISEKTISGADESKGSDEEEQLVVFLLDNEAFGIIIQMVESIIKKQAITKVPHVEKYILGVTNLRGTVVPVVDLRQRFSIPAQETTKDTRIIVLNTESGKNGIVVDEVMEVMRLPKSAIAPPPRIATTINTTYIQGVARTDDKLIIMLDMNSILQR